MTLEPCPPDDQLAELADGLLAGDQMSDVHRHVRGCSKCRLVLAGLGAAAGGELDDDTLSIHDTPAVAEAKISRPGKMVDRFRLERLVGRGGMGSVWAATDPELGRQVAIKLLFAGGPGSDGDPQSSRARLLREAKAMARLSHPNVIPVFEIGEERQRLFLVMELVEGETLAQWLGKPRSLEEILEKFLAAGDGLAAAHAAGVVHRDFKPENVLVGKDGRARVTDFGLARGHLPTEELAPEVEASKTVPSKPKPERGDATGPQLPISQRALDELSSAITLASLGDATLPSALTPMGALLGTPAYMSPEQMRGQRADARSDIFAFCTALFEAIFRARPYPARTLLEMRTRIEAGDLVWPAQPRIPKYLRAALARGLRANPAERPESMEALLAELRRGRKRADARWSWLLPAAVLVLLATLGGLFAAKRLREAMGPRTLAVLAPQNGTHAGDSEWIGAALSELVASELGGEAKLKLVPGGDVAAAARDLSLGDAALKPEDVARLRTRLSADLILGGEYRRAQDGSVDARLTLWEPRGGALEVTQKGDVAHVSELGAALAAQVRSALHLPARQVTLGAFPADLEAARLYAEGLQLERSQATGKATVPLEKAAQLAPENPRIQLALAEAYLFLRRESAARQAAQRAYAHKGELAIEEQPHAEMIYFRAMGDTAHAIEVARTRFGEQPQDLERGLQLADELLFADQNAAALELVARLHQLPPPAGNDARIDLDEAAACWASSDPKCTLAAATRAYASAEARGARWQMAASLYRQGMSLRKLGQIDQGLDALGRAEKLYDESGDLGGAAGARVMMGTIYADQGDLARAKEIFEKAVVLYSASGDRRSEATTLHNLAVLMRRAHDVPDGISYANRAVTAAMESGGPNAAVGSMTVLGNLRADMGDLAGAEEVLQQAVAIRRQANSPQLISALHALITVELALGKLGEVEKLLAEGHAADSGKDKIATARLDMLEAALYERQRKGEEGKAAATRAVAGFAAAAQPDDEALARCLLARAEINLGHIEAARQAIDPALAIAAKKQSQLSRIEVMITDTTVLSREHPEQLDAALDKLRAIVPEAVKQGQTQVTWSIRLAIARLELESHKPGAQSRMVAYEREARAQGFISYADQAAGTLTDVARARR